MAIQARTEFAAALNQLASEKGVDVSIVIEAIEQAALAAYRKDLSLREEEIPEDFEELIAHIDPVSGEISIMRGKKNITPPGFARIAAQTARQVIMQRLHEAEKDAITEPPPEQTRDEYYHQGQRLKFYIKEIREGRRGPEVVVSRSDPGLVKGLFAMEVPEIQTGSVVVKEIAREAGSRTKIAAISTQEGVDPVGSLVGQKGVRVQAVMNELGEERIDIISYSEDPARFIASALSPAKEVVVRLQEGEDKLAKVQVPSMQLSLAIGKGGQNVRLAAKITGYKIDIEGAGEGTHEAKEVVPQAPQAAVDTSSAPTDKKTKKKGKPTEVVAEEVVKTDKTESQSEEQSDQISG
ncbi:MAG: NusA antitermination factor [Candidatus Daviesbacteria bacterium GW2011_GWA2_42_7]|uniref:Transcription termination/antitermination protein NusA n=2 Tax=Candidatus Daviesiibacteriota TaxID=1752718 RepID=A0A0G1B7H7_9BACT|nr:MAG: NusA antitermination factor [Candidatus Daviesbacteria bacterium GW2011_GWA2_42_7]